MPGLGFKVKTEKGRNGEVSCSVEETNRIRAKLGLKPLRETKSNEVIEHGKSKSKAKVVEKNGEISCSIEETNRIRAKLGLKPLRVETNKKNDRKTKNESISAVKASQADVDVEARIARAKKKRKLKEKFSRTKTLAESSEDLDASEWINRSKVKQDEALKALEREKQFEELESIHAKVTEIYDSSQLSGIKISHHLKDLKPGEEVIMTLKDTSVLDEASNDLTGKVDELENVYIAEGERAKKRSKLQERIQRSKKSYAGLEEEYDEDGKPVEKRILDKYDFEDNIKKHEAAYVLNSSGKVENIGKNKQGKNDNKTTGFESMEEPRKSLLDAVNDNLLEASKEDYLTNQEVEASASTKPKKEKKIKKSKKKKKKGKEKKSRTLRGSTTLSEMIDDAEDENSKLVHNNNKANPPRVVSEDDDEEPDDMGLQEALLKARRAVSQKRKKIGSEDENDDVDAEMTEATNQNVFKTEYLGSNDQIFSTATQFSSAIESRMEDTREEQKQQHYAALEQKRSESGIIKVENYNGNDDDYLKEQSISGSAAAPTTTLVDNKTLKTEEDIESGNANARELFKPKGSNLSSGGLAAALAAFRSQGDIKPSEEEKEALKQATENAKGRKKKIDENTQFDIDLTYRDKNGKILTTKEAYVQMCYKFHGIKPGKNKLEKLKKREEQKKRMQNMDVGDTPLGTASALRKQTKKAGTAFITLDSNK